MQRIPLKTLLLGGLLAVLCSDALSFNDSELLFTDRKYFSENVGCPLFFKYFSSDDALILPLLSDGVSNKYINFHLTNHTTTEFHNAKPYFSIEPDSVKIVKSYTDCGTGHILNNDTTVCKGSIIELKSSAALTYNWFPQNQLSKATSQNPSLLVDSTRTYYLETTNYINNLVSNPDFELGNTGFYSSYTFCDGFNCLWPLGDNGYSVGTYATDFNTYFTGNDHTTGKGNFMIVNGARPSLVVWQQTIPVKPSTNYAFGVWISTMISLRPAQIQFSINGSQVGPLYNAPIYANNWDQVFTTWNSGSATTATIKIVDILPVLEGNDFGLDDLFFGESITCIDSVTVASSQNVDLGNDTIITPPDQPILLSSSVGPFEEYLWNTGDRNQSISITEPGKYWLSVIDYNGCKSVDTINVRNSRIFVVFPNAFTPNDDGINDVFRPRISNISKLHISIFNRWGQFLYETSNIETGWDGIVNGKKYPADLYVYVATYVMPDTFETKIKSGSFMLIK